MTTTKNRATNTAEPANINATTRRVRIKAANPQTPDQTSFQSTLLGSTSSQANPAPEMPIKQESPPPASQSHFAKFQDFTPNADAPFEHEFARLASSQDWKPGTQQYTRERTIALRQELITHYFCKHEHAAQTPELTEDAKLQGYQALCHEVGLPVSDSQAECKKRLKNTLVNIVDLIDARRTQCRVKVWNDFTAFRQYTLQPRHRIDTREAKKDGGYLASLLRNFSPRRRLGERGGTRRRLGSRGFYEQVVIKTEPA